MSWTKQKFEDGLTVISGKNFLNPLQDELIRIGDAVDSTEAVTPHIGDNGNWYIGSTDTGKPSRGATGAAGAKGETGAQGEKGDDGKTPVRGTDYWTAADKQEIVNSVIAALPDGTEVSY